MLCLLEDMEEFAISARNKIKLKHEGSFVPQLLCGDLNSMPCSSVMAILKYHTVADSILTGQTLWTIPADLEPKKQQLYEQVWNRMLNKRQDFLNTLGTFRNAYQNYNSPNKSTTSMTPGEFATYIFPKYTNYTANFKGTLDHIIYN